MSNHTSTTERRGHRIRSMAAMIVSSLALFVSLSGGAIALPGIGVVNSGDIKDNTVKSIDLHDNKAVAGVDVIDESLAAADLAADSVNSSELAPDSVTNSELAPNSVRASELGDAIHTHAATVSVPGGALENGRYDVAGTTAACSGGEELISGSAHWSGNLADEELFISEIELNHNAESVTASGGNDTANARTLVVAAHCL